MNINIEFLKKLKNNIEKLDVCHHKKILAIIKQKNINYSENRNGIFINMNLFSEEIIQEICKYLEYVKEQEKNLNDIESLKLDFKKDYFDKPNKEKSIYLQ